MHHKRNSLLAAALGLAMTAPAFGQEAPAPATAPPAAVDPSAEPAPPAAPAPAAEPPAGAAPSQEAPAEGAATAPPQPEITVTEHGDWEIGCLQGTPNCEMQQVANDAGGNPVILARMVRLPAGADALALVVFNTPLGTLLPPGLGFQVDDAAATSLPFEWCVQEGCVVRLGLREPDVAAMKRGSTVRLTVTSIADPGDPVEVELSLAGFTAGYDSLPVPPPQAAPPSAAPSLAPEAPTLAPQAPTLAPAD